MTKQEKETFLILRGWTKNQDRLYMMRLDIGGTKEDPKVDVQTEHEIANNTWDNIPADPTWHHKTIDEAMALEGIGENFSNEKV